MYTQMRIVGLAELRLSKENYVKGGGCSVRKYFIVRVSRLRAGPFPGLTGGDRVKLVDPEAGPCLPSVKQRALGRAGSGKCPLRNLAPERLIAGKVSL